MTSWLQQDIWRPTKPRLKKLSLKQQGKLIQLFNNLFASGFSLTEMVAFLRKSKLLAEPYTQKMEASLLNGQDLASMMADLGFSDSLVTQLALADVHGNTQKCLLKLADYLDNMARVKKKLLEVATYPFMLLLFLVLIMLGLKNYLVPQLEDGNLATKVIANFPTIFLLIMVGFALVIALLTLYARQLPRLRLASRLARLPWFGSLIRLYLTAYYAREWANLIGQGLELAQIVQLMQEQKSQLFKELGLSLEKALLSGQDFHAKIKDYAFFLPELSLMIEYGEVKSKLGVELDIYADECWETFFSRLTKATQLIQPFVFILVALVIVMIYAAMLLPMYQNMGGAL